MKEMKESGRLAIKVDSDDDEFEAEHGSNRKTKKKTNIQTTGQLNPFMSVFKEITDPEKLAKQKDLSHLFIGLDIVDDVSRGLRGFPRNIDRLTNQMVVLYKKMYP